MNKTKYSKEVMRERKQLAGILSRSRAMKKKLKALLKNEKDSYEKEALRSRIRHRETFERQLRELQKLSQKKL